MMYNFCMIMCLLAYIKKTNLRINTTYCMLFMDVYWLNLKVKQQKNCPSAIRLLPTTQLPKWRSKKIFFSVLRSRLIVNFVNPGVNFNLNFLIDVIKNIILPVKNLI